jgi:hypothetical protein
MSEVSGGAAAEGQPLRAVRIDEPGLIAPFPRIHRRGPCPRPGTRPIGSIEPKRLEGGRLGIPEEDRVYVFDDIACDLQKASFVFQGDQRAFCTVVHGKLQRFREGP